MLRALEGESDRLLGSVAGTFFAREPVSALYQFVQEALQVDWLPFELLGPGAQKLTDENMAFNECGLVSSALRFLQVASCKWREVEFLACFCFLCCPLGQICPFWF